MLYADRNLRADKHEHLLLVEGRAARHYCPTVDAQLLMQTYMWFRCAGFCKSEKRGMATLARVFDAMRESFVFRRTLFG